MEKVSLDLSYFVNMRQAELYQCPICYLIPHPSIAIEHRDCGKIFCKPCLIQWSELNKTCPNCKMLLKNTLNEKFSIALFNTMLTLIISCPNSPPDVDQCEWKGEWDRVFSHSVECPYGLIKCPANCGKYIKKTDAKQHEDGICGIKMIMQRGLESILSNKKFSEDFKKLYADIIIETIKNELVARNNEVYWGITVGLSEARKSSFHALSQMYYETQDLHISETFQDKEWKGIVVVFMFNKKTRECNNINPALFSLEEKVNLSIKKAINEYFCNEIPNEEFELSVRIIKKIANSIWGIMHKFVYGIDVFASMKGNEYCVSWKTICNTKRDRKSVV